MANIWHYPGTNDATLQMATCPTCQTKYEVHQSDGPSIVCSVCHNVVMVPAPEPVP